MFTTSKKFHEFNDSINTDCAYFIGSSSSMFIIRNASYKFRDKSQ